MFPAAIRRLLILAAVLPLLTNEARGALQTVWLIGVDEDPLASGYNATDEFSSENYINDPKPGKVYNPITNQTGDDDYYIAGN